MDIQFIEQEHRDNIFKIMELCNCEMAQAYELYNNNACNVQNAVQAKFNSFGNNNMSRQQDHYQNQSVPFGNNNGFGGYGGNFKNHGSNNFRPQVTEEDEYEHYRMFKQSGINFSKRYQIRRQNSGILKGVISLIKTPESNFKKKFQQYTERRTNLKLPPGSLSQCLQSVWKSKFPLIVHLFDFSTNANIKSNIRGLYLDEQFIQMLNTQFQNYGINTKQYNLQPYLKEFINLGSDANSLIVLRINYIDQIIMLSKISILNLTLQQIKKKLKQIKSNCINIEMEELQNQKRYQQQLKGNFDYQKPMSLADQRKLKEDRQIRRKQEQEFFMAMQPKQQQSKPSNNNNGNSSGSKGQPPAPKRDLKKQAQEQRQKIREKLKIYDGDGQGIIAIKLRLPSSQLKKLYVHSSQPAQYLYDFVFSRQQNLGFEEDETKRLFDIIEPYDKINLSQRKKETLGKVFEGQSMLSLVVNEKSE